MKTPRKVNKVILKTKRISKPGAILQADQIILTPEMRDRLTVKNVSVLPPAIPAEEKPVRGLSFIRLFDRCLFFGVGFGIDAGFPRCLIVCLGFHALLIGPHTYSPMGEQK